MEPDSINISGPSGPNPSSEVDSESKSTASQYNKRYIDSLSRIEQEKIIAALLASSPHLQMPVNLNSDLISKIMALKTAELGSKLWDEYSKSLQEQADRILREISSPAYQAWLQLHDPNVIAKTQANKPIEEMSALRSSTEFNTWLNSLPIEAREKELHFNRVLENTGSLVNGVNEYFKTSKDSVDAGSFMAAALTIASGLVGGIAGTTLVESASTVISQVMPLAILDPTTLTINLFAIGLIYSATAETIGKAIQAGKKPQNLALALNFAEQTLMKIKGDQINQFLLASLMNRNENGKPITSQRAQQFSSMAKIVMLSLALGAIYKGAVAWITDKEFVSLLQNPNFKEGSINPEVQDAIKRLVSAIQIELKALNPKDSTTILAALLDYFGSNPSFDSLFDPLHAYTKVLDEIPPHPDLA